MFVLARKEEQLTWDSFIESQLNEAKAKVDNTEIELREAEIESLKRKNKTLQKSIEDMKKQLHASEEFDRLELELEGERIKNKILQESIDNLNKQLKESQGLMLQLNESKKANITLQGNITNLKEQLQRSKDSTSVLLSQKQKVIKSFFLVLLAVAIASGAIIYSQNNKIASLEDQLAFANSKAAAAISSYQSSKSSKSSTASSSKTSLTTQSSKSTKSSTVMVWIPRSGKKYHKKSTCSNMNSPSQVTLSEAKQRGFTPCSKCDPPE